MALYVVFSMLYVRSRTLYSKFEIEIRGAERRAEVLRATKAKKKTRPQAK